MNKETKTAETHTEEVLIGDQVCRVRQPKDKFSEPKNIESLVQVNKEQKTA